MQPIVLNFVHANGFPSGCYRRLFAALPSSFEVQAKDQYGHDKRWPVNANWNNQIQELIEFVQQHNDQPVYAVGHSFGACLSLQACCLRSDLFKGLIMLDPPAFTGWRGVGVKLLKMAGLTAKFTPAGKAEVRKQTWSHMDEVFPYFRGKALFELFSDAALQDYITAGIEPHGQGGRLRFKAAVEAELFHNIPDDLNQLKDQLTVPATLVTASKGSVMTPALVRRFLRSFPIEHLSVDFGGHLFALEQPHQTAALVTAIIQRMEQRRVESDDLTLRQE